MTGFTTADHLVRPNKPIVWFALLFIISIMFSFVKASLTQIISSNLITASCFAKRNMSLSRVFFVICDDRNYTVTNIPLVGALLIPIDLLR